MEDFILQPEIIAHIYYLSPEEGGRKYRIVNGYRGQFFYDDNNWDAVQEIEEVLTNGTVSVKIQFISPDNHKGKFYIGKEFEIREGLRVVGKGKIVNILRDDFNI